MNKYGIVLAAGKGTRMKSLNQEKSKVGYEILGKALVNYVIDAFVPLGVDKIITVVGFGGDYTKSLVEDRTEIVWQKETKGTGHAVMMAEPILKNKDGSTLVFCGDAPLIRTETLSNLYKYHEENQNFVTVLSGILENPKGYGRIIRDDKNNVLGIKEDRDCSEKEQGIKEINSGIYVFNNKFLFDYIGELENKNNQGEYYLTDMIDIFAKKGLKVGAYIVDDVTETFGINDRNQLAYAAKIIKKRINKEVMLSGVTLEDPDTTYIAPGVEIGRDTIIGANTHILGKTKIGENNVLGPNNYLFNVEIGNNNNITSSYLTDTKIGNNNEIGPFTKTRAGTWIEDNCRVGNFVELKDAHYHNGVKSAHLTYIGDAEVGEKTNIGCGSITANYDGFNKTRTSIGKETFIGSGTILIAPITVADHTFTAAGSTITKSIEEDTLSIARARQVDLAGGYTKFRAKAKAIKEAKTKEK